MSYGYCVAERDHKNMPWRLMMCDGQWPACSISDAATAAFEYCPQMTPVQRAELAAGYVTIVAGTEYEVICFDPDDWCDVGT